jgi:hypothetical protein
MTSRRYIRAGVSTEWLAKADRLFRNDDVSVWAELLQNSRRAKATVVDVKIEEALGVAPSCFISITDNGRGISDFGALLQLGKSEWDAETQETEDPAGMGFFALCRSHVDVHSGDQFISLTPECFQGKHEVEVHLSDTVIHGTRVSFTRASSKAALTEALKRVTEFCPLEVHLEGETLERHDFLAGSLHRELSNGIVVGLAPKFTWNSHSYIDPNWNFYGVQIRNDARSFPGYIPPSNNESSQTLLLRFDVLEAGKVKLQLPDRRAIIEDSALQELMKLAHRTVYEFFQRQTQHVMPFHQWQEAKELGVLLPEAASRLKPWNAQSVDQFVEPFFGDQAAAFMSNIDDVILVANEFPYPHTLDAARQTGGLIDCRLYESEADFKGYSWYDSLPRLVDAEIFVDEIPYDKWLATGAVRPSKMEMEIIVQQANKEDRKIRFPISIHVNSAALSYEPEFVAVQNGPWDNDRLAGPFSVVDFLVSATFSHSDDGDSDSWETQNEEYKRLVHRVVNAYFRGPEASLRATLYEFMDSELTTLAEDLGVTEIRLKRTNSRPVNWGVELICANKRGALTEAQFLLLMVARSAQAKLGPLPVHAISAQFVERARNELLIQGVQWDAPIEDLRAGLPEANDWKRNCRNEVKKPSYEELLEALERIVLSADSEGCSEDLTVVERDPVIVAESMLRASGREVITNL